jgi:5-methylcytosine-specific restriction endonuclease McrA
MAPRRPCVQPGCPDFASGKYARCEAHQREHWRRDNESDRVRLHRGDLHRALRRQVLAEEDRCANPYCVAPEAAPTLDYIVPLVAGGKQTRANAQRLCLSCNSSRGAKPWPAFLAWAAERARLSSPIPPPLTPGTAISPQ